MDKLLKYFIGCIGTMVLLIFLLVGTAVATLVFYNYQAYKSAHYIIKQQGFNRYGNPTYYAESITEHTDSSTKFIDAQTHKSVIIDGPVTIIEK